MYLTYATRSSCMFISRENRQFTAISKDFPPGCLGSTRSITKRSHPLRMKVVYLASALGLVVVALDETRYFLYTSRAENGEQSESRLVLQ